MPERARDCAAGINRLLDPIRQRRAAFARQTGLVEDIIRQGSARAREECHKTLHEAREAMGLTYFRDGDEVRLG